MNDIYNECPTYRKKLITLRQTNIEDAQQLLKCYSDENALPLFNSDNCNGDDFHYTTLDRMREAINFWEFSYENKYFVRWTVILNSTGEIIGTIEMFHRIAEDEFNHHGVLRIDLQSRYENKSIIDEILEIANENFFKAFAVDAILIKSVPAATQRIESLMQHHYQPLNKKMVRYDDYFINHIP